MKTFGELPKSLFQYGFETETTGNKTPLKKEKVEKVANWIASRFEKSTKLYKENSSYGLKHIVERNMKEYVANGELIAAMIMLGFDYKNKYGNPNCDFYLDKKSVRPYLDL